MQITIVLSRGSRARRQFRDRSLQVSRCLGAYSQGTNQRDPAMPRYTIRIELLDAQSKQYDALYEHLNAVSITDRLTDADGNDYLMPPGEYNYEGLDPLKTVLSTVRSAASKVAKNYRVLITEAAGRTWFNLEKD